MLLRARKIIGFNIYYEKSLSNHEIITEQLGTLIKVRNSFLQNNKLAKHI